MLLLWGNTHKLKQVKKKSQSVCKTSPKHTPFGGAAAQATTAESLQQRRRRHISQGGDRCLPGGKKLEIGFFWMVGPVNKIVSLCKKKQTTSDNHLWANLGPSDNGFTGPSPNGDRKTGCICQQENVYFGNNSPCPCNTLSNGTWRSW